MERMLLLLLLLPACGDGASCLPLTKPEQEEKVKYCSVDQLAFSFNEEVLPFLLEFSADAISRKVPCHQTAYIGFQKDLIKDNEAVLGYCYTFSSVRFIRPYWDEMDTAMQRTLFYHELGHCALGLDHESGQPDIMNPYILPNRIAVPHWDELVNSLFLPERKRL